MSFTRTRALASDMRDSAREEAIAAHKAALEAQQTEEPEFVDAGYDETLPGQVEVVAGTVQHEQLLNQYHNATSYGPTHNVVVPEPEVPPEEVPPDPPPEEPVVEAEYASR